MNTQFLKISRVALAALFLAAASPLFAEEPPAEPLPASDVEGLRNHVGQQVVVRGTIANIGQTGQGDITFLNFDARPREGFVAVVFHSQYTGEIESLREFLGKTVEVTGRLEIYRENQPQIRVRSPEQIVVTED